MNPLPLLFKAQTESQPGTQQLWQSQSLDLSLPCAIPPEFKGPGGGLSPEDFFVQAMTNCFLATFKVIAENSKLHYGRIHFDSDLFVDKNDQQKTVMKKCHFKITLTNVEQKEKANLLIKKAFETGFILNSVKTELSYEIQFAE